MASKLRVYRRRGGYSVGVGGSTIDVEGNTLKMGDRVFVFKESCWILVKHFLLLAVLAFFTVGMHYSLIFLVAAAYYYRHSNGYSLTEMKHIKQKVYRLCLSVAVFVFVGAVIAYGNLWISLFFASHIAIFAYLSRGLKPAVAKT